MPFPGKRFGNTHVENITVQSDDTTVDVFLRLDGDFIHSGTAVMGTDVTVHGDFSASLGTTTVRDIDVISPGTLTIALGASVDSDATDFAVEDMQVGGTIAIEGTSAMLSVGTDASVDIDTTDFACIDINASGTISVGTSGSLNLSDTTEYTSNAIAISAGYVAGDIYNSGSGALKIVV